MFELFNKFLFVENIRKMVKKDDLPIFSGSENCVKEIYFFLRIVVNKTYKVLFFGGQ